LTQIRVKKGLTPVCTASKLLALFGLLSLCVPVFGQERLLQKENGGRIPTARAVSHALTAPIQAVFTKPEPTEQVNSALPGLGTLTVRPAETTDFAGSLTESVYPPLLNGSMPASVPAIYVESRGYVPISDPSIAPYISPDVLKNPASDPAVVMIPAGSPDGIQMSAAFTQPPARAMEITGKMSMLSLPQAEHTEPVVVSAQTGWSKKIGTNDVYFLQGDCTIRQGSTAANAPEAVVWIAAEKDATTGLREIMLYLEEDHQNPVKVELGGNAAAGSQKGTTITDKKWLGHFYTSTSVDVLIAAPKSVSTAGGLQEPAIYQRSVAALSPNGNEKLMPAAGDTSPDGSVVPAQYLSSTAIPTLPGDSKLGFRRISLNSRSDSPMSIAFEPYPHDTSRGILILSGGLNLIIEGIADNKLLAGSVIDISADNAVVWMVNPSKMNAGTSHTESDTEDFEIYLEGNIVYRDGPRLIEADKMYYDAKNKVAYILNGHLSAPIDMSDKVNGAVRLKAEILRQMGDGLFTAKNAMITTSQLGEPTYSLRSRSLTFDRQNTRQVIVAENNTVAVRNMPVFYWPWMAADLGEPTLYIKNFSYSRSGRNGHTVNTRWNPFQILNCRRPEWIDGDVNVSYMTKRGLGYGADFQYDYAASHTTIFRPSAADIQVKGDFFFWGLNDRGTDQLGGVREDVQFPHDYRYRLHWVHEYLMPARDFTAPFQLRAEIGKVSDRNFMPGFFDSVWHTEENATTALSLNNFLFPLPANQSLKLSAEYSLDNCYSNANWLPRLDHFIVGQPLLNDYFTWYGHTRVGLMNYNTASTPFDVQNDVPYFRYLPWETQTGNNTAPLDETGLVFSTRHELDYPVSIGALKVIPFVLGDFSLWGNDRSGKAVNRLYGQGGVRLHLPFWKVQPNISSRRWYLNGLAHKIDFDAEYWYAQANESMENLILTDPIDNWSIDDFRRRYAVTNSFFGANGTYIPPQFDPRYYALRSGIASNVTAGNMEIADDMSLLRLGMTHRFQTKRGSVGNRHIMDWITASTHVNFYPESDQNFGKGIGLWDYNVLWHVGDRFSVFSEGLYDFFDSGQSITRIGSVWNRPERGSVSVSLDQFSGAVERTYLTMNIGYTMNEKYAMTYMTSFDIKDRWKSMGHNFMFARTGESFRLLMGVVYSEALSDWSLSFGLEPVFLRKSKMQTAAGR
jgi:lipopolysaccharide export system protein LptA